MERSLRHCAHGRQARDSATCRDGATSECPTPRSPTRSLAERFSGESLTPVSSAGSHSAGSRSNSHSKFTLEPTRLRQPTPSSCIWRLPASSNGKPRTSGPRRPGRSCQATTLLIWCKWQTRILCWPMEITPT